MAVRALTRRRRPAPSVTRARTALVLPVQYRAGPHVCRSLAAAGHRVIGAKVEGRGSGGRSLACPRPLRYPSPSGDPAGFVEWLVATCRREEVDVVVPTTEDAVRLLAPLHGAIGAVIAGPTPAQFAMLCDKARLAATAAAAGLAHPGTVGVSGEGVPDAPLPPPPWVVKPAGSGEEAADMPAAVIARTAVERDAALARLRAAGTPAVVQEYLDGPRWFVHAVRGEDWFRMVAFRAVDDWPRRTGPASFFHLATVPRGLEDDVRGLLDAAGYRGTCSLSVIAREGRLLVHDVNLRVGATVEASIRAGLDVPALTVAAVLGLPPGPAAPIRPVTYVRTDGELGGLGLALRRRGGEPVLRQAGRLVRGALRRDWVLDPSPADPYWLMDLAFARLLRAGRRLRPG